MTLNLVNKFHEIAQSVIKDDSAVILFIQTAGLTGCYC